MKLQIFTDGGSKGNPGPAAIGIVCYDPNRHELFRYRKDIGIATNNVAEYTAVITALEMVRERMQSLPEALERVDFYSDSQLLVKQLNGEYKVKKGHIQEFVLKIRLLEADVNVPIYFHYIPRAQNKLADALVNDKA